MKKCYSSGWIVILYCFSVHRCNVLQQVLIDDQQLKQPWEAALQWLHSEMERVRAIYPCTFTSLILPPSLPPCLPASTLSTLLLSPLSYPFRLIVLSLSLSPPPPSVETICRYGVHLCWVVTSSPVQRGFQRVSPCPLSSSAD